MCPKVPAFSHSVHIGPRPASLQIPSSDSQPACLHDSSSQGLEAPLGCFAALQ